MTKAVDKFVIFFAIFLFIAMVDSITYQEKPEAPVVDIVEYERFVIKPDIVKPEQYEYKHPPNRWFAYHYNWVLPQMLNLDLTYTVEKMKLTSLGYFYLTAYAPEECGYNGYNYPVGWQTASGIICHRASYEDRLTEPTTCAVDRRYYRIGSEGQQFYIPAFDRVFVAEDTGSAVIGAYHIDLFYDDYYEMASFPTGYYEVFTVEYVTEEVTFNVWQLKKIMKQEKP